MAPARANALTLLSAVLLVACQAAQTPTTEPPVETPTPVPAAAPTRTPIEPPTSLPAPSPTAASPSATPSATLSPSPTLTPYDGAEALIEMAPGPRGVAIADGSVWVASTIGGTIQRVDPAANDIVAEIDAGRRPVTLVTIDGELWASVLNGESAGDDEVVRIDTANNAVDIEAQTPVHHNIATGSGAVWAIDMLGTLSAVDASSGQVNESFETGLGPVGIAADDSAVWGIRGDRTVWRYDIHGGALEEADLDVPVPGRSRIAVANDLLWIAVPGSVLALDAESLAVQETLQVQGMSLINDLLVTDVDVWLSANVISEDLVLDGGSVLRIDPATVEIVDTFRLGPESSGVAVADGSLWAVDQADDLLARFPLADRR